MQRSRAERGIGRWKKAPGASAYLVMLYRDAKRVGHPHRTSAEQYDFVPLMQTAGVYHFKVIPLTKQENVVRQQNQHGGT